MPRRSGRRMCARGCAPATARSSTPSRSARPDKSSGSRWRRAAGSPCTPPARLSLDRWNGAERVQLRLIDVAPADTLTRSVARMEPSRLHGGRRHRADARDGVIRTVVPCGDTPAHAAMARSSRHRLACGGVAGSLRRCRAPAQVRQRLTDRSQAAARRHRGCPRSIGEQNADHAGVDQHEHGAVLLVAD